MTCRPTWALHVMVVALASCAIVAQASAQARWQTESDTTTPRPPAASGPLPIPGLAIDPARNTTIVPRSTPESKTGPTAIPPGQVSLIALLTQDGQNIEQGIVWRIYRDRPGADGKPQLVSTHREASPMLRLEPGSYIVNVTFGRAHLTRKVTFSADRGLQERFVLNAGGLRLMPALSNGDAITDRAVAYDIYSDERDQAGQRTRVMNGV